MGRCTKTRNLEVHHKRRDGGNDLSNAEVLCGPCHANTSTYGEPCKSPPAFSQDTKDKALKNAGNQCECTRTSGCH
jgi:5-methylcytosine-specific restriction endonuclease McrA